MTDHRKNNIVLRVASAAITGTTVMTAFSYYISAVEKKNFREPQLLGELLRRLVRDMDQKNANIIGWNIHYAVGVLFAFFYALIWRRKRKIGLLSGLVLGGISGLVGILAWRYTFRFHPHPPHTNYKQYYRHLFLAHLFFGVFASIGYQLFTTREKLPVTLILK